MKSKINICEKLEETERGYASRTPNKMLQLVFAILNVSYYWVEILFVWLIFFFFDSDDYNKIRKLMLSTKISIKTDHFWCPGTTQSFDIILRRSSSQAMQITRQWVQQRSRFLSLQSILKSMKRNLSYQIVNDFLNLIHSLLPPFLQDVVLTTDCV